MMRHRMSVEIQVPIKNSPYSIEIHPVLPVDTLADSVAGKDVFLLTDEKVGAQVWMEPLVGALQNRAGRVEEARVPAGEASKSIHLWSDLCSRLAARNFNRHAVLLAVGGGVVGDLGGFLAATYLRGIGLIQVPTTLLAMVDSSVGGKTGVNLPEGKNLVGAFYQPEAVWIGLDVLNTLPDREFSAGMAEVIKYGMIRDPGILDAVEQGRPEDLASLVARCVEIKRDVVVADEKETTGERAVLNFGHTVGHAIEQYAGYGELLHGEAISIGMMAACRISQELAGLSDAVCDRLRQILQTHQLPVSRQGLHFDDLQSAMARDKKATSHGIQWVLCPEPGNTVLTQDVPEAVVRSAIEACSEAAR